MASFTRLPVRDSNSRRCFSTLKTFLVKSWMYSSPETFGLKAKGAVWIEGFTLAGAISARMSATELV